ncbi:MAG: GNAT family N-acetyltransferase [Bryobacterales bacterium]|nr:GNAT family N-acetyltransferase [Bryobacterales bacterium]
MALPVIETQRLELRPYLPEDASAHAAIWRVPEVRRYLFDDREITLEEAAELLAQIREHEAKGLGLWSIWLRDGSRALIGAVSLMPVSTAAEFDPSLASEVEPLIVLDPSVWGRGYATEALTAVLCYGFDSLRLERIVGINDVPNQASDRVLRRVGFEVLSEFDGPKHRLRSYTLRADQLIR